MSWSITLPEAPGGDYSATVDQAVAEWRNNNPSATEDTVEQINVAANAAKAIASSGAVGRHEGVKLFGSIGGHSNPGHEPTPAYANDTISVYINQVSAAKPA